jgi:hypothetical protein
MSSGMSVLRFLIGRHVDARRRPRGADQSPTFYQPFGLPAPAMRWRPCGRARPIPPGRQHAGFRAFIEAEHARWKDIVVKAKLQINQECGQRRRRRLRAAECGDSSVISSAPRLRLRTGRPLIKKGPPGYRGPAKLGRKDDQKRTLTPDGPDLGGMGEGPAGAHVPALE